MVKDFYRKGNMVFHRIYNLLSSVKLAIALLVVILISCFLGVTVFRGDRAWQLIFNTTWFNSLLVLLVVNVASCFFPRIWRRKFTLTTFGMILFHLSFVFILLGVVYNSLFYFRGTIRLTEGETLPNGYPQSYDSITHGRFFDMSKMKGETTLIRMHTGYKVDGKDKRVAYEIAVGEGIMKKRGVIYITHSLGYNGFRYFNSKEGYSLLVILYDKQGKELYGAYVPLQSLKQKNDSYLYTTGSRFAPGSIPFPQHPLNPMFNLQVVYIPSKDKERSGEASFRIWSLEKDKIHDDKPVGEGKAWIGERVLVGDYYLEAREVRYWVGMDVRYEPGKPIVLTSLWVALSGVIITFIGRLKKRVAIE